MKVCILAVCYNSYKESLRYLDSIYNSIKNVNGTVVFFYIDNSSIVDKNYVQSVKSYKNKFEIKYTKCENLGYYPSISYVINKLKIDLIDYDYSILSNVDLRVSKDFFANLKTLPKSKDEGIYAPSIYSKTLSLDRNPKITRRPTAKKLKLNRYLYYSTFTYFILKLGNILRLKIRNIINFKRKPYKHQKRHIEQIYAPHGAFKILTNEFSKKNIQINYPIFLFCEEIYLGEMCREHGLKVIYRPDLVVYDSEGASTSLMETKDYRYRNRQALSYILKKYNFS